MAQITFYKHEPIPMEMHKVKIVQQLKLLPTDQRLERIKAAGFNTFQLHNGDIFMDMLTDSGVNAMSDNMQSAMLRADDAYAGSETFFRMQAKLQELFGIEYCLPTHQRICAGPGQVALRSPGAHRRPPVRPRAENPPLLHRHPGARLRLARTPGRSLQGGVRSRTVTEIQQGTALQPEAVPLYVYDMG